MTVWHVIGALVVMSVIPFLPGMPDHESRWLAGLWALGGLGLTLLGDPLLAVGLGLIWVSPVAAWPNMRALVLSCHVRDIACERGPHPVVGSLLRERIAPALVAFVTGLGVLLAERWVIRAGHLDALRWGLLGLVMVSLAWGLCMPSAWARNQERTQGLSGNPVHYGELMALALPAASALPTPWRWAGVLLTLGGLLDSRSRMAAVAIVPALALLVPWWLTGVGLAVVGLVLWRRWRWSPSLHETIRSPRWRIWAVAWRSIGRFPWAGIGLGAFGEVLGRDGIEKPRDRWDHAHNEWLHVAAESGIPSATVLTLWFTGALGEALSAGSLETASGLAALGILSLTGYPLRVPEVAPLGLYYVARGLA